MNKYFKLFGYKVKQIWYTKGDLRSFYHSLCHHDQGDSGGPLTSVSDGKHVLVGVVSSKHGDCDEVI